MFSKLVEKSIIIIQIFHAISLNGKVKIYYKIWKYERNLNKNVPLGFIFRAVKYKYIPWFLMKNKFVPSNKSFPALSTMECSNTSMQCHVVFETTRRFEATRTLEIKNKSIKYWPYFLYWNYSDHANYRNENCWVALKIDV